MISIMENKNAHPKKKSPRAPSTDLEEAVRRIENLYNDNNLLAVSSDAAAESIGYKNGRSGTAKAMLATVAILLVEFLIFSSTKNQFK